MATIKVTRDGGLKGIGFLLAGFLSRARKTPKVMSLAATGLATAHQFGYVSKPVQPAEVMQRTLAAKFFRGAGQRPPSKATLERGLKVEARPVTATKPMAIAVAEVLAAIVLGRGAQESPELVMRADVDRQFRIGGDPAWPPAKPFGSYRAAKPPLGGVGGTIHDLWRRAAFRAA